MSKIFELAKKNYPDNWNIEMLKNLVSKGRLSEEEFREITGKDA